MLKQQEPALLNMVKVPLVPLTHLYSNALYAMGFNTFN